ncbi:BTB/POZ domain-containing protein 9-like [Adelges cooleyi]|uniref:BTB/POZ domain-containing protein 9-like n=1 Tax=Adelges cooleyi TaxID=133065 RepID=UPI0021807090|nr:BTB/POZ domain-containing protein 9-like [Adelges cooleyi]
MDLRNLENKVILELLILSNKIGFTKLQFSLSEYLRKHINVNNVSSLFSVASFYQLKELEAQSLNFIDVYALDVLQSEDALSLSPETLQLILNRDTAYANEVDIFRAACRWIKKYQNELYPGDKTKILSAVRYQLMDDEELSEVRQSDLVRSDTIILDVIKSRIESLPQEFNGRGQLIPNVNFAEQYQKDLYQIDGGTMITFYYPLNINYIEMIYGKVPKWNEEIRPYSYYIEVSTDKRHWLRVVDHSNYHCQSTQRLWINRRFVRYIRIVGTENTSNKKFDFLKVMYNTEKMHSVEIKNGFVAPKYNVILENVDTRVVKIMPEHMHVTLTQPYVLSSLRMLLNDDREPISGYTIKVSTNNKHWDMIVNKSHVLARSWQLLRFESKLVVYILITSERTFLHCVDLEAPAQVLLD